MSNYTIDNLIPTTTGSGRIPAIKIGGQVFPMHVYGNSGYFYKCASVDTASQTWTGYRALLTNGVYSFMPTVTTGLTYSVVTPAVGKVYADGALVEAKLYEGIPINGMVVLISGESLLTAETGQTMTATQSGLDLYTDSSLGSCLNFFRPSQNEDGGRLDCATGISSADSSWSFSTWIKRNSDYGPEGDWYNHGIIFGFSGNFYLSMSNSSVFLQGGSGNLSFSLTTTNWNHVSLTCSDNTYKLYVNGILSGTTTGYNAGFNKNTIFFGRHPEVSKAYGLRAYLKSIRLYDRDLTPADIVALANEFTPTQA